MDDTICRAITFINYNIPIRDGSNDWDGFAEFYTTGFFDRMYTKRVDCDYTDDQLKGLWDYNIGCIAKGDGTYAHQNIYCFSKDDWNEGMTDEEFWSHQKHKEMLLTFVIFVQTREYMGETGGFKKQCRAFNEAARRQLQSDGFVYTYGTVDKNDFVICIRSRDYKKTVNAIMELHEAGCSVVYSYSVFGISKERQTQLSEAEYKKLNDQKIDSISLKGVANSTKTQYGAYYALDDKYISFCKELAIRLYEGEELEKKPDYKIYDILGDNDFRMIARAVPLGNLIRQFGANGKLDYKGDAAQYTCFSTHLVLNTMDKERQKQIGPLGNRDISGENSRLQKEYYKAELCEKMKSEMEQINRGLSMGQGANQGNEKLIAAFHGVYQLIQSLTALEAAPTKKYDFFSLYYPLNTLISILKKKMSEEKKAEELAENNCLYDFIHKISMTLHGTLRTDIQFFQIRDFNATVHYAPAKLRAFYSFFVFMLSAHFREISLENNKHSYIFSPGMFRTILVQQLFDKPDEKERLMLITVPERYLYFPKNLCVILAHEVGHLIGDAIRKRKDRHTAILKCSYRTMCLEITNYISRTMQEVMGHVAKNAYASELTFKDKGFLETIMERDERERSRKDDADHIYYSGESLERIHKAYKVTGINYGFKTWNEYCCGLKDVYRNYTDLVKGKEYPDLAQEVRDNHLFYEEMVEELSGFFSQFESLMLPDILKLFHHIMSETVSDLLAILVLGLKPIEYVNSLADEIKRAGDKQTFDNGVSKVRIALVFSAAQELCKEFAGIGQLYGQFDQWNNVYKDLITQCEKGSRPFMIAMEAYTVQKKCEDKLENIEKYESSYNRKEQVFSKQIYDFLNDRVVYQYMCEYLVKCGREYLGRLRDNPEYVSSRKIISEAFRDCADSSPIGVMSQVDTFLANFEMDWRKRYF